MFVHFIVNYDTYVYIIVLNLIYIYLKFTSSVSDLFDWMIYHLAQLLTFVYVFIFQFLHVLL